MKKILVAFLFAVTFVAAPVATMAQSLLTDYDYSRITFGNTFTDSKVKPIILSANRAIHAPVSSLALLEAIPVAARYQGMLANVDTGMYFYDETDCGIGATSPTAVAPDDAVGCWYLVGGAADIWDALASTTATSGATLVGVYDVGTYFTGTTVEAALAELGLSRANLALTTTPGGASYIGVFDDATYFTGTNVEAVLAELGLFKSNLALTTVGNGATLIGTFDTGGYYTAENVEATLQEIGLELSTTMPTIGTPSVGYFPQITALGTLENSTYQPSSFALGTDVVNKFLSTGNTHDIVNNAIDGNMFPAAPADGYRLFCTGDDGAFVEGKIYTYTAGTTNAYDSGVNVLAGEVVSTRGGDLIIGGATLTDYIQLSDKGPSPSCKTITVALGASSGSTDADPDWVGATIQSYVPVSGNDQPVASIAVAGDGAVTLTTAAVETAEAVFRVCTWLE